MAWFGYRRTRTDRLRFLSERRKVRRQWMLACAALMAVILMVTIIIANHIAGDALRQRRYMKHQTLTHLHTEEDHYVKHHDHRRYKRQADVSSTTTQLPTTTQNWSSKYEDLDRCIEIERVINMSGQGGALYPEDQFEMDQLRSGAIALHFVCLVYMFLALALVCDEFFVPALGVITEKLQISEDVAGATFMAAGGSAPEFFTSVIGVFISSDNVGIGTIVGSATFNILFVLAFCVLFSKGVLELTWWPLFRDISFYVFSLGVVVWSFLDETVTWHHALGLFCIYLCYCTFMKFNEQIELFVRTKLLGRNAESRSDSDLNSNMALSPQPQTPAINGALPQQFVSTTGTSIDGHTPPTAGGQPPPPTTADSQQQQHQHARHTTSGGRRLSMHHGNILHNGAMYRGGIVQLMVQPLEHMDESHHDNAHVHLEGVANVKLVLNRNALMQNGTAQPGVVAGGPADRIWHNNPNFVPDADEPNMPGTPSDDVFGAESGAKKSAGAQVAPEPHGKITAPMSQSSVGSDIESSTVKVLQSNGVAKLADNEKWAHSTTDDVLDQAKEEAEEPLDISWPDTNRKRLTYLLLIPIIIPLWLTLPDVRREESRKWFPITFIGSILWIAVFSYVMVWMATTIGETFRIPIEIMGLTLLAAGTSIPDLITSVLVARKGFGDMAVSSSVGSNIFDVCCGLPIPWLLYFAVHALTGDPRPFIPVTSKGLVCSVGMLFIMLIVLAGAIAVSNWRMHKIFGFIMIASYVVFVIISVMLETDKLKCFLGMETCVYYLERNEK